MSERLLAKPQKPKGRTLVGNVRDALKAQIEGGRYKPGDRLPSEAQLTKEFSVSRTVVREAIASLRADCLLESRQGAGIFVLETPKIVNLPFQNIDFVRVSSMIEMLELRTAVEVEAAGLAAQRKSPSQEERIVECYRTIAALAKEGKPTSDADFEFHLAIADATNNPRFREFLVMIGPSVIPRRALGTNSTDPATKGYLEVLDKEHEEILSAVLDGDEARARRAMRHHLKGSQSRYRSLLRSSVQSTTVS